MKYFLIVLASVIAVEGFTRLPVLVQVQRLLMTTTKAGRVITAKAISDHWKERVVLRYALDILLSTIKLVALMALTLFLAILPALFVQWFIDPLFSVEALFSSWVAISLSIAVATTYYTVRSRLAG